MESKLIFLVVCLISCAVSSIKAESTPTNLTPNITRNECGKTKLCVDLPKGCDPSGSSQCDFTSVALSNISLTVELSGNSSGYIALAAGVTSNVSQGSNLVFVCGNNNTKFFYNTAELQNATLRITNKINSSSIQGLIQPSLIQCVFSIAFDETVKWFLSNVSGTHFNSSNTVNSQIPVFLDIFKGSTNGTQLGPPTRVLESSALINLADANSTNVVSTPASTTLGTTASTTAKSNASIPLNSLLSHAAICLLSIFLHLI